MVSQRDTRFVSLGEGKGFYGPDAIAGAAERIQNEPDQSSSYDRAVAASCLLHLHELLTHPDGVARLERARAALAAAEVAS